MYTDVFFSPSSAADCPDSVPSSTETGGTNCLAPGGLSGKTPLIDLTPARGSLRRVPLGPLDQESHLAENGHRGVWGCELLRKACSKGELDFISVAALLSEDALKSQAKLSLPDSLCFL